MVVCPLMARANHSCRPNAEFVARIDQGSPFYIIIKINIYKKTKSRPLLLCPWPGVNELRAMYVIEAGEEGMIVIKNSQNLNHKLTELFIFCF